MSNIKKTKKTKGKLTPREFQKWCFFTLFMTLIYMVLGGFIISKIPEVVYLGNLAFDVRQGLWFFGMAFVLFTSTSLGIKYHQE